MATNEMKYNSFLGTKLRNIVVSGDFPNEHSQSEVVLNVDQEQTR